MVGIYEQGHDGFVGISSCISSSRFGPISTSKMPSPVRLPSGRFKLVTSPNVTGSNPTAKTIGVVEVAAFAIRAEGPFEIYDDGHLPAHEVGSEPRQSIVLAVGPAVFDRDVLPFDITGLFQAATEGRQDGWVLAAGALLLRNPITGIVGCCARAALGSATIAPPRSVMKSRRFICLREATPYARLKR